MTSAPAFRSVFAWLMIFVGVFWAWTVALMIAWPWDKDGKWAPDMRIVAVCANKEPCSIAYGDFASAKAQGKFTSLIPAEPVGEVQESDAWVRWTAEAGKDWQYEVKRSSWHFEASTRYRIENDAPVLIQARNVDADVMLYSLPLAIFSLSGLFFRRLRK